MVVGRGEGSVQGWLWEVRVAPWKVTRWPEQGPAPVTGHLGGCQSEAQTEVVMRAGPGVSGHTVFLLFSWVRPGTPRPLCCDAATRAWSAQQGHSLPHLSPDWQSVGPLR